MWFVDYQLKHTVRHSYKNLSENPGYGPAQTSNSLFLNKLNELVRGPDVIIYHCKKLFYSPVFGYYNCFTSLTIECSKIIRAVGADIL